MPTPPALPVSDLGRLPYREGYDRQMQAWNRVLAAREGGRPVAGEVLLVEHPPVITLSARPGVEGHLLASPAALAAAGVAVESTDRGGDITYHGPGQLVVYPILDLNHLGLRLHDYMRRLEDVVIATLAHFNVHARREPGATGVWVDVPGPDPSGPGASGGTSAKVCAMGIRVKQWISLHGLALNVHTNLDHFNLIVPCGLAGRPVTSLARLLGHAAPPMALVKQTLLRELNEAFARAI